MMTQRNPTQLFQEIGLDQSANPYVYGVTKTDFGPALLIHRAGYLVGLGFTENLDVVIRSYWPKGSWEQDDKSVAHMWEKVSRGEKVPMRLMGTAFQQKVWMELLNI